MIIGRDKEQRELHEAYESEYSELAAIGKSLFADCCYIVANGDSCEGGATGFSSLSGSG